METDNHPVAVAKALTKPQRRVISDSRGNNVGGHHSTILALHRKGLVVDIGRDGWRSGASLTVLGIAVRAELREGENGR